MLAAILLIIAIVGFYGWHYYSLSTQPLFIEFTESEVTLEYGQTFLPSKYIKNYTKSDNAELVMPESTKMDAIGDQTMIYQIKNGYKTETFELNVHTVDTQTPVITLNTHDVTLTKGVDVFTAEAYPQYKLFKIDIVFSAVSCVFKIMNSHIFNILAS